MTLYETRKMIYKVASNQQKIYEEYQNQKFKYNYVYRGLPPNGLASKCELGNPDENAKILESIYIPEATASAASSSASVDWVPFIYANNVG